MRFEIRGREAQRSSFILASYLACALASGCSTEMRSILAPNQPPSVELVQQAAEPHGEVDEYHLAWQGHDSEGAVSHFVYAIDPPSIDRVDEHWTTTEATDVTFTMPATRIESSDSPRIPHTFAVRAVDRAGAMSEPEAIAFVGANFVPSVRIVSPFASGPNLYTVTPSFTIGLEAKDGDIDGRIVKYKYTLLSDASEFPLNVAIANPDSLLRYYAPAFAGWDSIVLPPPGALHEDHQDIPFENLTIGKVYLFAVTVFDDVGDYPPFSFFYNLLLVKIDRPKALGPSMTFYGDSFVYEYQSGFYDTDLSRHPEFEMPPDVPITIRWSANAYRYRWALDPPDPNNIEPRSDPSQLEGWSAWGPSSSVTLGPFASVPKGERHHLYVEAENVVSGISLGILGMYIVPFHPNGGLLIVDDTRLQPDFRNLATGCAYPPGGKWPTAAELDTFLYARGGYPWKCYPAGTESPEGIFMGYRYDTLGTRRGSADPTVSLSTLSGYDEVVWITDPRGAANTGSGSSTQDPITSLRYMSASNRVNTLATFAQAGGKVWLLGAGAGMAATMEWNDPNNDIGGLAFSVDAVAPPELGPGRFMYDMARWQSEFIIRTSSAVPVRFTGRYGDSASTTQSALYATLPATMARKDPANDPLATQAPTRSGSDFYLTQFKYETLFRPNTIVEDVGGENVSTLDTLYRAQGSGLPGPSVNPHNVVMTYYHGLGREVVFSGFDIWSYRRSDCVALVDFVLGDLWGLTRVPEPIVQARIVRKPD